MSNSGDLGNFARWAYSRATSHPIKRIEQTLETGKPAPGPSDDVSAPNTQPYKVPIKFRTYGPKIPKSKLQGLKNALIKKK